MIETKKTRAVEINADNMTSFGWALFQNSVGIFSGVLRNQIDNFIFQRSNDETSGNFVISSLGPQLLLSLINKETRSETKKEIRDVIGTDGHKQLGQLIKLMTTEVSDRELQVATAMFVNADYANR